MKGSKADFLALVQKYMNKLRSKLDKMDGRQTLVKEARDACFNAEDFLNKFIRSVEIEEE